MLCCGPITLSLQDAKRSQWHPARGRDRNFLREPLLSLLCDGINLFEILPTLKLANNLDEYNILYIYIYINITASSALAHRLPNCDISCEPRV